MRIGVLALQGAFIEHVQALRQLGAEAVELRQLPDLEHCPAGRRKYGAGQAAA